MHVLKSVYVSAYIAASLLGLSVAGVMMAGAGPISPWLGTALACLGPVAFFARVFALPVARTSPNLHPVLAAGVLGTLLAILMGGALTSAAVLTAAGIGILGTLVYVHWYSRFATPTDPILHVGNELPSFSLFEHGAEVASRTLVAKPALWIFYRGNWCPLCVAQIKEIAAQYRELARRGVDVFLVSPQPEANTEALAAKCGAPMRFLTDRSNRAAAALGIVEKAGLPAGMQMFGYDSDVPRPTVFITAKDGRIVYCDLTDNYRVRPEPAQYLPVLDRVAIA